MIDTGNPRVFSAVPGPVPVEYPYPLWGYGYCCGLAKLDPRVNPYPYPWRVTRGYALTIEQIFKYLKLKLIQNNREKVGQGTGRD